MITAITVSTKYDDILKIIMPQNYKFFTKWYIVTHEKDTKTINIVKNYGFTNVEIVFFDFYRKRTFNKGGAIRKCQDILERKGYKGDVLILDSDIYLPNNFLEILPPLNYYTLYGTNRRSDYYSYHNFKNNILDFEYKWAQDFQGYFQLYKFSKNIKYLDSDDCSECDLRFQRFFKNKIILQNMIVSHLGKSGINWKGRKNYSDFSQ